MELDKNIGNINIVSQDIGRVLLNLFTNAFYSVTQKKKRVDKGYEPFVIVRSEKKNSSITIVLRDNGLGISQRSMSKIFNPFSLLNLPEKAWV